MSAPTRHEDESLVAVSSADSEAFAQLYDRVAALVYGIALRVLGDVQRAEEVARQVLLEAWRTTSRPELDETSARTWMVSLAHVRAVERLPSDPPAEAVTPGGPRREPATTLEDADDRVARAFEHDRAPDVLDALTDRQRKAVVLTYYEGMTHSAVAEFMRLPPGTVTTRIRRALLRLEQQHADERPGQTAADVADPDPARTTLAAAPGTPAGTVGGRSD